MQNGNDETEKRSLSDIVSLKSKESDKSITSEKLISIQSDYSYYDESD